MSDTYPMTTAKPVFVYYDHDVEPDELHPAGMPAGFTAESPSPEIAKRFHPHGRILRYADGSEYNDRKATAELRERDKLASDQPVKAKKGRTLTEDQKAANNARRAAARAASRAQAPDAASKPSVALSGSQSAAEHVEHITVVETVDAKRSADADTLVPPKS